MSDEKATLIKYRLSQARESLKEADVLLREGMSKRSVMNRLYYAMFYALLALLQDKQLGHPNIAALYLSLIGNS